MSEKVYFICDDSCEPLDPDALLINSMHKSLFLERYGHFDWAFETYEKAFDFCREEIQ